jgi:hypothetical protein
MAPDGDVGTGVGVGPAIDIGVDVPGVEMG